MIERKREGNGNNEKREKKEKEKGKGGWCKKVASFYSSRTMVALSLCVSIELLAD